jgi:MFS family permease
VQDDLKNTFEKSIAEHFKVFSRAFSYPNYRLYFSGQTISNIGTWMQRIAMGWLIYRLTDSELLLGILGFASQIPSLIISPFAGVLADRWDRHKIIIITQFLSMVQAFALAALVLTNRAEVWHLIALGVFLGVVFAFDLPMRHAFLPDMVEKKEDLSNAIAMNSLIFNVARIIGPAIAGIVIKVAGEGVCFIINGLSYLAVIIALMMMKLPPKTASMKQHDLKTEFIEGAKYSFGFAPIREILVLLSVISLTAIPYLILMPVFAKDVLKGDASTLGNLWGAVGAGAIIGGIVFALRKSVKGIGRFIAFSTVIFCVGLITFSLSKNIYLSMFFLALTGFGQIMMFSSANTSVQTITDEDKRGRVMAFYSASIMGITPFGNLIAGSFAELIGAPTTLLVASIICLLGAADFYRKIPGLRKHVRPIFIKSGVEYTENE